MTYEAPARAEASLAEPLFEGARVFAAALKVPPEIHKSDCIFRFITLGAKDRSAAFCDYFQSGAEAAVWLKRAIGTFRSVDEPFSLLEFAAGYGRVSRHIPAALPQAQLVASDIHPEAIEFLRQIGIKAHQSTARPDEFEIGQTFDVIFALSFFTHMPRSTWSAWLHALLRHLAPGGCLIFTTHGVPGMKVMGEAHGRVLPWDKDGFWFEPMSEQDDIDTAEYGSTGTSFRFVSSQIEASNARLYSFQERGAGYQDVYIVRDAVAGDEDGKVFASSQRIAFRRGEMPEALEPNDCIFYHSMDVPGLGPVQGQWDLRGAEQNLFDGVSLADRSVLEIGPASGYLTFWMERQGARVTALDLDAAESWDIVPFADLNPRKAQAERSELIRKVNNAWWYTRSALDARADCVYGNAYDLDASLGSFDVVTLNNVLLHLRDPLSVLERAAQRADDQIVITDVSENLFAAGRTDRALQFVPQTKAKEAIDSWWYVPSTLVEEYLAILGFANVRTRHFQMKFCDGHLWDFYTVVGTRTPSDKSERATQTLFQ